MLSDRERYRQLLADDPSSLRSFDGRAPTGSVTAPQSVPGGSSRGAGRPNHPSTPKGERTNTISVLIAPIVDRLQQITMPISTQAVTPR